MKIDELGSIVFELVPGCREQGKSEMERKKNIK